MVLNARVAEALNRPRAEEEHILKAVLIDLDNTLIRFNEEDFFRAYIPKVAKAFCDIMPFPLFYKKLIASSQALLKSDGSVSNAVYFSNTFSQGFEDRREELWKRFMDFYRTGFDPLKRLVTIPEGNPDLIDRLQEKNLKVVIASNPLWPMAVQKMRLAWAGLEHRSFDLITSIENMSFCKPRIEYYREVCKKIQERPEQCLMVGNDPVNDMVVTEIGMKTYLVEDGDAASVGPLSLSHEIRKGMDARKHVPDFRGTLANLASVVDLLRS